MVNTQRSLKLGNVWVFVQPIHRPIFEDLFMSFVFPSLTLRLAAIVREDRSQLRQISPRLWQLLPRLRLEASV